MDPIEYSMEKVLYPTLFDQIGGGDRTIEKYLNIKY